ncbi:hypothetical protein [Aeoliella sp. SH292]|uniref:hypothetical protein n=1 Tax=Aeoliella sp. SH292 TaxID=3454464 RepID=UPI003F973C59
MFEVSETVKQMPTNELFKLLRYEDWHLDKYGLLIELASRALVDENLLPTVWDLIGREIAVKSRLGTPLGAPAAALLIDSDSDAVLTALGLSMSRWSEEQQADFLLLLFRKPDRRKVFDRLVRDYGLRAKTSVNDEGELSTYTAPK